MYIACRSMAMDPQSPFSSTLQHFSSPAGKLHMYDFVTLCLDSSYRVKDYSIYKGMAIKVK